jgi:uncharacterized protein YndB with AHSA1/START domain
MTDSERGYSITRTFDAPRELVWKAWTEPDQFGQWFGGAQASMKDVKLDVRPDGQWSGTMVIPDHPEIFWRGFYVEVVEPERLVMVISDEELREPYETYSVTLTEVDGKTEQVVRQSGGNLSDEEYLEAKAGTATFLDAMAELVEGRS